MERRGRREVERDLLEGSPGVFAESELRGLPGPVAAFFRTAVAPGAPIAVSARIRMRGSIRIGRWVPFRAREVLNPHVGFVWTARAAGLITGSDRFSRGTGAMDWRLFGLVPVMRSGGTDVSRSAAERAAAEAVWIPTALLPRFGVEWSVVGENQLRAAYRIGEHPLELDVSIGASGRIRSVAFERWGDPDNAGEFARHAFGGVFVDHARFSGITVPVEGRLGWHYGTERWPHGEFFRYRITDIEFVTDETHSLQRPA